MSYVVQYMTENTWFNSPKQYNITISQRAFQLFGTFEDFNSEINKNLHITCVQQQLWYLLCGSIIDTVNRERKKKTSHVAIFKWVMLYAINMLQLLFTPLNYIITLEIALVHGTFKHCSAAFICNAWFRKMGFACITFMIHAAQWKR